MKKSASSIGIIFLIAFATILVGSTPEPPTPTACADGYDNDGDGFADDQDNECRYITPDFNIYCFKWDNETVAPTSFAECDGN